MFYAKLKNGVVERYPYTITDLRLETPNVSFPTIMTDAELSAFGVVPVAPTAEPTVDYTKDLIRWAEKNDNVWIETWAVVDASQSEIEYRLNSQWKSVRNDRNKRLFECDWTQLTDAPLTDEQKAAWQSYRQALRDVTQQTDPFNITWPVKPE